MSTTANAIECPTWCSDHIDSFPGPEGWGGPCWSAPELLKTESESGDLAATVTITRDPSTSPQTVVLLETYTEDEEGVRLTAAEARRLAGVLQRAATALDNHPAGTKLHVV